jgi:hypothetical protein
MSGGSSSEGPSGGTSGASSGRSRGRASGDPGADRRPRRKATLSSTSYDEAAQEPRHPEWQGSSWYGTSSGTYWTINPREYADPRKHGPEYQARARRAGAGAGSPEAEETVPGGTAAAGGFATSGAWDGWTAAGQATQAPMAEPVGESTGASGSEEAGRDLPTAGSIGLLAGGLAAIPAATVALASLMSGDPSLVPVTIGLPALVGLGVGLAVALSRRARSG